MARIDTDWQIGEFVSDQKIGPRLAQDWLGLARIDTDWHGLTRIDTDWQIGESVSEKKLAPDWHKIGTDWHGLTQIGTDWQGLANWKIIGETESWPLIGNGLAQDWR